MTEYVIETEGLTVYYGRHLGITDVDLKVEKGEVFGFLGPNGAGKTTTQRVLLDVSQGAYKRYVLLRSRFDGDGDAAGQESAGQE